MGVRRAADVPLSDERVGQLAEHYSGTASADALRARVRELEGLVMNLAERLCAASEALGRVAERKDRRGK